MRLSWEVHRRFDLTKYYLNKNIHVVTGAKNHCIYDLEKERLFSIDQSALEMLNKFLNTREDKLTKKEEEFLQQLLDFEVLTTMPPNHSHIFLEKPTINFAWIEVTKACNLRCVHCYNEAEYQEDFTTRNMDFQDFCRVVDMLQAMGVPRIQLIGGEPYILGNKLAQMLSYIKDKFQFVEIFTNGTLIKESDIDTLLVNNINQIALSVYSNISSEHDKVTKLKGSYNKTLNTIKALERAGIPYRIANVRMKEVLVGETEKDLINAKSRYDFVRLSGRGNLNLYDINLLTEKLITKNHFKKKISRKYIERNMNMHNCFSNKMYIDVELNVYPCVMERRIKHGNIRSESIEDILQDWILTYTKDRVAGCRHCEYRYACHDCRPDRLSEDINAKPWYCTYNPLEGKWCDIEEFIKELEV